jgi:hypothetical protein
MGIVQLLKFIKNHCNGYSKTIQLTELAGKTIVIDTSIYMYKFKIKGELFENFYLLCMLLLEQSIIPVFVFDGPHHFYKKQTLKSRTNKKKIAEEQLKNLSVYDKKKYTIMKNKTLRITKEDNDIIKDLLNTLGIMYIDAPYEADEICALMVLQKKAYACLSEDTDMFAYGCCNILRTLDLFHETVVLYNMPRILRSLRMPQSSFREMCILSGTDYNKSFGTMDVNYQRYKQYKASRCKKGFYQWLFETQVINGIIFISKLYMKFDLLASNYKELKVFENITLDKKDIFQHKLKLLLRKNYFVNP